MKQKRKNMRKNAKKSNEVLSTCLLLEIYNMWKESQISKIYKTQKIIELFCRMNGFHQFVPSAQLTR